MGLKDPAKCLVQFLGGVARAARLVVRKEAERRFEPQHRQGVHGI